MRKLLLLLFIFSAHLLYAQEYEQVDSIVKLYPPKFKTIESLAKKINDDFETDLDKTRAAYYWISNNISYDYVAYRKNKGAYKAISYDTESEYQNKQSKQEYKYAEQCLRRKKAVCEGYSQLLKFTLEKVNVECEVVSGFTKTSSREIGRTRSVANHAWNVVKIDNKWMPIDATWSTGNRESSPEFNFDDTYFRTNPEKFILDHFPRKEKWQLVEKPINKSEFFLLPKIYSPFFNTDIKLGKASLGLIQVKANDTIKLAFENVRVDKFYRYAFKDQPSTSFLFEKIDNEFILKIPFKFKRPTSLTIYFEDKSILKYRVIAKTK